MEWVADIGFEPYPAQVKAIEELLDERHVVLDTPTGSGKSLVATALHFKALCEGKRSFYTAPIKALVSEKFFTLVRQLGSERVGLMTGDASVNRDAPVICCTAEILSNLVLRNGQAAAPPYVIMDEFHYYADRERGTAWQIPLIALPDTTFLLMSATLGDMSAIASRLFERSGREVVIVQSDDRPVPLDFTYLETPLHETIDTLRRRSRLPAYVVSFTQRDCAERAQALTSLAPCTPAERSRIAERLASADFDTPYGQEMRRMLQVGVAVHHAGLLPRYRLLVEQLAQDGLLKVICGTDTLGVGVNIPIRTVVFTGLAKYDGHRVRLLDAREFKQIGGRAGRRGFDVRGSVVCQAPLHVIENRRRTERAGRSTGRSTGRRPARSMRPKGPEKSAILWNERTFRDLVSKPPEPLRSQFRVTHGMLLATLQRSQDGDRWPDRASTSGSDPAPTPIPTSERVSTSASSADQAPAPNSTSPATPAPDPSGGYRFLVDLVMQSHDSESRRHGHLRGLAQRFRSLRSAGIVELVERSVSVADGGGGSGGGGEGEGEGEGRRGRGRRVVVNEALQDAFSLHQTLSLFLVDAVATLDPFDPEFPFNTLSIVEAILEDPRPVLFAQERRAKEVLIARLKEERVPYEEWRDELERLSWPKPLEDFLEVTFDAFAATHPWVERDEIRPKSVAREMVEGRIGFNDYVRSYGLQRSEGTLLRYLGEVYRALAHAVPETHKDDALVEIETYLRRELDGADASLLGEWERLQSLEELLAQLASISK